MVNRTLAHNGRAVIHISSHHFFTPTGSCWAGIRWVSVGTIFLSSDHAASLGSTHPACIIGLTKGLAGSHS